MIRSSCLNHLFVPGLKGRETIAQGSALGEFTPINTSPVRATEVPCLQFVKR
jgi:hypothetical protein